MCLVSSGQRSGSPNFCSAWPRSRVSHAVGARGRRVDRHHPHAVIDALRADGAGEGHQAGVAHGAGDVVVIEALAGQADDVHHRALLARVHLLQHGARGVDVAEHLQLPGLAPLGLGHGEDVAARDGAGIVHQDVGMAHRLDHASAPCRPWRSRRHGSRPARCGGRGSCRAPLRAIPSSARRCARRSLRRRRPWRRQSRCRGCRR